MSPFAWIVDDTVLRTITWTLVHFLWQGTVLALALALATHLFRPPAFVRHAAGILTLTAMLALPVVTFSMLTPAASALPTPVGTMQALPLPAPLSTDTSSLPMAPSVESASDVPWFTLVPVFWMAGVMCFGIRLAGGWLLTRRLVVRGTRRVDAATDALARDVAGRLGLRRPVRLAESSRVTTPAMFGWVRPVILLPAATIAGLTSSQLEAVIAHELVHVRRHDYLINLLQSAAEAVLFFHPAVWWVSRYIRREREHCCDDAVVSVCDRMEYVRALTHLAKAGEMQVALAASGGSLLHRVQRLLGQPAAAASGWTPTLGALLVVAGLTPLGVTTMLGAQAADEPRVAAEAAADVSVAPAPVATVERVVPVSVDQHAAPVVAGRSVEPVPVEQTAAPVPAAPVTAPTLAEPQVAAPVPHAVAVGDATNEEAVLRSHLAALATQLETLKRQQLDIEQQRAEAQAAAMVESVREELEAARAEHERQRMLVEIGRADGQALVEVQARVRTLERTLQTIQNEAEYRQRAAALQQQQAAQMTQYDQLRQQYEALLTERSAAGQLQVELAREAARRERAAAVARRLAPIDDNAAIARADVVRVEIEGESDLPSEYTAGEDGAIRLPLLGRFAVQGRTPADLAADIRAALTRSGLKPDAAVRVQVLRAR